MNSFLLNRQLGNISQHEFEVAQNQRLLQSLQHAGNVFFREQKVDANDEDEDDEGAEQRNSSAAVLRNTSLAHTAGVTSIAIDRFEGKYLLSGGADSSVSVWDLESPRTTAGKATVYEPIARTTRTSTKQSLGITHLSFYPFDSLAFLTTGYDQTLKIFSSETLEASATFDLGSVAYSLSMSTAPSSDHLLVACATQHPAVRLVDLRSGANTHSLAGHSGALMAVAWHPKDPHILASGATDGCVRLWDVRRSASSLGVLDMDDSIGIAGYDGTGTGARRRERGRAHNAAVNGVSWTEDTRHLVSYGHDDRMRVWDMEGGANTLANFGPALKNSHGSVCNPLLVPSPLSPAGQEAVFVPNGEEILGFDLHSGALMKRLRCASLHAGSNVHVQDRGIRNLKSRTTSLAWRAFAIEMYSSHSDGTIRCWKSRTWEDGVADEEVNHGKEEERDSADRKRKREELDQIVRDLTRKPVTFT